MARYVYEHRGNGLIVDNIMKPLKRAISAAANKAGRAVAKAIGKLVRQSQIVQSVMQDYQYDLSHLLPVCNLLAEGPKIITYNYCLSRRSGLLG